jgi:hypothetical protein
MPQNELSIGGAEHTGCIEYNNWMRSSHRPIEIAIIVCFLTEITHHVNVRFGSDAEMVNAGSEILAWYAGTRAAFITRDEARRVYPHCRALLPTARMAA